MMEDALANLEAESDLLGGLMFQNNKVDAVADLIDAADFSLPLHQQVYAAIVREVSLGNTANPVTLKPYFDASEDMKAVGGTKYLAGIYGNGGLCDCYQSAKHLVELAHRRNLRDGLMFVADHCAEMTIPTADLIEQADEALVLDGKETIHQPTGGECFDELLAGFDDKTTGVTCGCIESLDEVLGEIRPKQLVIGAGRPGMGKTAVALSYGIGAAFKGHGVLYVSLEMSSHELAGRMAADMAFYQKPIPFSAIRDGDLTHDQRKMVAMAGQEMARLPFQVVDAGGLTIGRLKSLVRRHKRKMAAKGHKLELVIVDYLQLLSGDSKGRSNYETVSEISKGMKAMAKDQSVGVLALAQLSREVERREGKRPQLADLRDSGQIEQDADAVVFLLRNEYYLRQEEPDEMDPKRPEWEQAMAEYKGQIEFIVAKRRNGVTGTGIGQFHGAFQAVR